jgi:hypothetical protein
MVDDGQDDRHGLPLPTDRAYRRSRPAGAPRLITPRREFATPRGPDAAGRDVAWTRRIDGRGLLACVADAERQHALGEALEQRQESTQNKIRSVCRARACTRSDPDTQQLAVEYAY